MRYLLALIVFGFCTTGFAAYSREDGTWEFYTELKSSASEKVTVRIITGPWEASEHKIEADNGKGWKTIPKPVGIDYSKNIKYRIDGQEHIWGADGFGWPDREVRLFVVQWGEKTINVTRKHWRDYYWLLLFTVEEAGKNPDIGGCWTEATIDSKSGDLVIVANGGGGAGWYRATWKIKSDGTISDSAESTVE